MPDSLAAYWQKRDFRATPEPRGEAIQASDRLSFVVQKHAATRLHYDFRLELDGTLKSWAVPKGPSLDPTQKRMAVHVEDHPLAYASFEGIIPPRQYGAGSVIVWDRGTWEPLGDPREGYRAGKLKFRLTGEKLQGNWALVRMHGRSGERQEPWLLIKERDEYARSSAEYDLTLALPDSVVSGKPLEPVPRARSSKRSGGTAIAGATPEPAEAPASGSAAKPAPSSAAPQAADEVPGASTAEATAAAANPRGAGKAPRKPASTGARATRPKSPKLPEHAVPAPLPPTLAPQLATLVAEPPAGGSWSYEIKFDGYRIVARVENGEVRLLTRNAKDWTGKLAGIGREIAALNLPSAWLDGEIVVLNQAGASDFAALQNAFESGGESIVFFAFDLPFFDGHDLRAARLEDRRHLLATLLESAGPRVRFSEDFHADAGEVLRNACQLRLEGVIGKRLGSPYVGRRSPDWIKLKCTSRQEFVIGGYTEPQGTRIGLGALLLGVHDAQGRLRFAGSVGTGFDTRTLGALRKQLASIESPKTPFFEKPREARGTWVEPKLVAEVSFAEWTRDGKVRHAVFHGLRSDKPAEAITRETPAPAPKGSRGLGADTGSGSSEHTAAGVVDGAAIEPSETGPSRSPTAATRVAAAAEVASTTTAKVAPTRATQASTATAVPTTAKEPRTAEAASRTARGSSTAKTASNTARGSTTAKTASKTAKGPTTSASASKTAKESTTTKAGPTISGDPPPALPAAVRVTNPQRVIDPTGQHTKRELVDHYLRAARRMLPHLVRRPVALMRAPTGIQGQLFFQKHAGSLRIAEIRQLPQSFDPEHPPLLEIDTFTALISAAQMNVVEFHTWNANTRSIDKPDRMTFDLDPGEGIRWPDMVRAAMLTRAVLDELGLRAFVKTSGGKGVHVVVPLAPRDGWDDVKEFSRRVVEWLAATAPDTFVAKSGPKNRVGRIFADYLRNGRGATTVAAFSARARPGLGVSVPCDWDELGELTGGDHWNIATVHERLESAEDPWAEYAACRQTLGAARKALAARTRS